MHESIKTDENIIKKNKHIWRDLLQFSLFSVYVSIYLLSNIIFHAVACCSYLNERFSYLFLFLALVLFALFVMEPERVLFLICYYCC